MTKTIIITGASSGIGKALAEHLAFLNYKVIAVARSQKSLEELHKSHPDNITAVIANIIKAKDRLKILKAVPSTETGIYLVHNAGIANPSLLTNLSETDWDQHSKVNLQAPLFLTKLLLPHLKNGGRVLNISSGLAHSPLPGMTAYGITKAALFMMKEYLNAELAEQEIAFASAMPGIVDTPIQKHMRSTPSNIFPAVELFKGFYQRNELLAASTVAKFLSWLLFEADYKEFVKGDWDIYDTLHHPFWAQPGDIKPRKVGKDPVLPQLKK